MCNRFRSIESADAIRDWYKKPFRINFESNPNAAPTDSVPIIRSSHSEGQKAQVARFGMIPNWSRDKKTGLRFLNARVETVTSTPAYGDAFKKRRCVIPAAGYYEWREEEGRKQPYLFSRKDGQAMALAGLWDYTEIDSEKIFSFTIITNEPNSLCSPIHDRMPCILASGAIDDWLACQEDGLSLLIEYPSNYMAVRPVNPVMNNPRVKDKSVIDNWPVRQDA